MQKRQKEIAKELREEDAKKWTQAKVASELGVAQQTVADWLSSNTGPGKAAKPDSRVKLNPQAKEAAVAQVAAGKSQEQVAANFGVAQTTISAVVRKAEKETKVKRERAAAAKKVKGDCGDQAAADHATDFTTLGNAAEELQHKSTQYVCGG